jgi:hypothetical protein
MTAAFSFGFAGDDIDDDRSPEIDRGQNSEDKPVIHTTALPAKRHSLENLVSNVATHILIILQIIRSVGVTSRMTWNDICLSGVEADTELPIYRHPILTKTAPNTLSSSLIFLHASRTITWMFLS